MPKIIAIATGDWHIHKFRNFNQGNSRLLNGIKSAEEIIGIAKNTGVPILFSGDLLHNPKEVENETNSMVQNLFKKHSRQKMFAISGNHDMSERNSLNHQSPSHLNSLANPNFHVLDNLSEPFEITKGVNVWGIPYYNSDADLVSAIKKMTEVKNKLGAKRKNILLLHTDLPGAKTPSGFQVDETENIPRNLDKFFKGWDLVLVSHIHKPQRLSTKCIMLGAPIHQDEGDEGTKMGYWLVYDDMTVKFKQLKNYPQFIRLKPGEDAPDNRHYYIKSDEVLVDENTPSKEFNLSNSKSKLAKSYLTVKGIKKKSYKKALVDILNQSE